MRVCFVNSFYPPYVGGAERYVSSIAGKLSELGHDVTVYCASKPLHHGENYDGKVRVVRMKTPMMFYGTPITMFPDSFFGEDYDIIHANFPSPYLAAASSFVAKLKKTPSVLTWHNDLPAVTSAAALLVGLHDLAAPIYLSNFRKIIATTNVYAERSKTLRKFADRVVVIPNGVDTSKFNPNVEGDRIREKYKLKGKNVMLFVSVLNSWHRYKGLDYLLRATAIAKKMDGSLALLIVGSGSLLPYYRELAKELRIEDVVIFAGFVRDDELPEYYAACDFFVLPSIDASEGFGIVLLEAMASGKPVIGSRVGGMVDVIRAGENGLFVSPNDVESLASKIIELAGSDEERIRLGKKGREIAEFYHWRNIVNSLRELYAQFLED
jgi:glycosyltransferase involved in cell wall biosynthesis